MNAILNSLRFAVILALVALIASPSYAVIITGNLVTDPSFESNPLIPIGNILGPPFTTGSWGAENGANVGPTAGITPATGAKMHRMDDDGLVVTQSFQLIDVSAYQTQINAGNASLNANILYNVPQDVQAATAVLYVNFYDAAHAAVAPITVSQLGGIDNNPASWQPLGVSAPVPPTTKFLLLQGAYVNATMKNAAGAARPGFLDDARLTLTLVPEPSTIGLAGAAMLGLVWLSRRRKSEATSPSV